MEDFLSAFNFLSNYIHVAGWLFLIGVVARVSWKASYFFQELIEFVREGKKAAEQTRSIENTIATLATNHMPHLQQAMVDVHEEIKGLRNDLLIILSRK